MVERTESLSDQKPKAFPSGVKVILTPTKTSDGYVECEIGLKITGQPERSRPVK